MPVSLSVTCEQNYSQLRPDKNINPKYQTEAILKIKKSLQKISPHPLFFLRFLFAVIIVSIMGFLAAIPIRLAMMLIGMVPAIMPAHISAHFLSIMAGIIAAMGDAGAWTGAGRPRCVPVQ